MWFHLKEVPVSNHEFISGIVSIGVGRAIHPDPDADPDPNPDAGAGAHPEAS